MTNLITGKTEIYGIIGYPVKHSFSPIMHNAAFFELKMDARYLPFSVKHENIPQAIQGIKALGIAGINVTIPHKSSIIPYLDEVTPLAKKIGAVNTVKNDNGRLIGTNTDVLGFIQSLKKLNFSPTNKIIGLLGAGGSARALIAGLSDAGASKLLIHYRTVERAERLELEFSKKKKDDLGTFSTYLSLGDVYSSWAKYDVALKFFKQAFSIESKNVLCPHPFKISAWCRLLKLHAHFFANFVH